MMRILTQLATWLIKYHPQTYLKWKNAETHRLSKNSAFLRLHARLVRNSLTVQRLEERYNLWVLTQAVANRQGMLAEVGVYKGGSAMIICEVKGKTPLYLFDTFSGMPAVNPKTDGAFRSDSFANVTLSQVQALLADYPNVHFYPGIFPASATTLAKTKLKFKLVHIDVDLYSSTLDALTWFYPRMVRGGLIVTHDYGDLTVPGVKLAFDKFFANKREIVMPLWFSQAIVTKL